MFRFAKCIMPLLFFPMLCGCKNDYPPEDVDSNRKAIYTVLVPNRFIASIVSKLLANARVVTMDSASASGCGSFGFTKADITKLRSADLVISGFGEPEDAFINLAKRSRKKTANLSSAVDVREYYNHSCRIWSKKKIHAFAKCEVVIGAGERFLPWMNPRFLVSITNAISSLLKASFPKESNKIERAARLMIEDLSRISKSFKSLSVCNGHFFGIHDDYRSISSEYSLHYEGALTDGRHGGVMPRVVGRMKDVSSSSRVCVLVDDVHAGHNLTEGIVKKVTEFRNVKVVNIVTSGREISDFEAYKDFLIKVKTSMEDCVC